MGPNLNCFSLAIAEVAFVPDLGVVVRRPVVRPEVFERWNVVSLIEVGHLRYWKYQLSIQKYLGAMKLPTR